MNRVLSSFWVGILCAIGIGSLVANGSNLSLGTAAGFLSFWIIWTLLWIAISLGRK